MKTAKKQSTLNQQKQAPHAKREDGESALLAAIAALPEPDRAIAERLHAIIES